MSARRAWSRDELLAAFRLYCRTPFGKLHRLNPRIIALARLLRRTPSAVGMKACNFASLDPVQRARGIKALGNLSAADRALWAQFAEDSEAVAAEAEVAYARLAGREAAREEDAVALGAPEGPTDVPRTIRARRVQGFFRAAVLASYEWRCALSDLGVPELLNASHIIPLSVNAARRADPRNGLCLNALYDRAFDRGLIGFDDALRVILSPALRVVDPKAAAGTLHREALLKLEGKSLRLPRRFEPDRGAIAFHRERVFRAVG